MTRLQSEKRTSYSIKVKMGRLRKIFSWNSLKYVFGTILLSSLLLSYLSPFIHPNTAGFVPFFGLAFPVLIVLNILFFVVALFKRSKWAILSGLALIIGFFFYSRIIAFGSEDTPYNKEQFKVLSYNVRLFDLYNPNASNSQINRKSIIQHLEKINADIMCFQEFYHQDAPTNFPTRDSIMKALNAKYFHERYVYKSSGHQNFGVCLISKYPLIEKGNVIFDNAGATDNFCIYADAVIGMDTVRFYNVHLQSIHLQKDDYALFGEHEPEASDQSSSWFKLIQKVKQAFPIRANQALKIREHINTSPYPVVVCGDFNDTPMSYTYSQFNNTLTDAFRNCGKGLGSTYAGRIPAGRIDYIFHSEDIGSLNFHIQDSRHSDHYSISCNMFKK